VAAKVEQLALFARTMGLGAWGIWFVGQIGGGIFLRRREGKVRGVGIFHTCWGFFFGD